MKNLLEMYQLKDVPYCSEKEYGQISETTEQAIKYIHTHYQEPSSLYILAKQVNMSKFHFSRVFKRECGCSPHQYLIYIRMNQAMHLLKTTDLSVKEVGISVGYDSQATFSAAFCKRVGISPKKFRQCESTEVA